jgi:hypothetical protein
LQKKYNNAIHTGTANSAVPVIATLVFIIWDTAEIMITVMTGFFLVCLDSMLAISAREGQNSYRHVFLKLISFHFIISYTHVVSPNTN